MKKILFVLALFISIKGYAQDQPEKLFPVKDGKVVYEEVVELAGAKKDVLYLAAKKWLVGNSGPTKIKIDAEDKESGLLIGKALTAVTVKGLLGIKEVYNVNFTFQIDSKDGKYRYRIFDIIHSMDGVTESSLNAKYVLNILAEKDNEIALGAKGYSKANAKAAVKLITAIDEELNRLSTSLKAALKSGAADTF